MTEIRWLTRRMVAAFHQESQARFGGAGGIRDEGLLESALARPRNRAAYGDDPSIFTLAADYCAGIVRNHPFVDGNKRAGLLSAHVFLALNGWQFEPDEAMTVEIIEGLAAGRIGEDELTRWFAENSAPKT
ncbi:MAG: type II toxin-antitoxin system death-on-curing family toxin [Alphaproteobacteria bacterium]|nr:type II toxin-antitoxin system death-on-curing family toxin [Alphaproteobacteria bacterium]